VARARQTGDEAHRLVGRPDQPGMPYFFAVSRDDFLDLAEEREE
jgi:hypothetical protein